MPKRETTLDFGFVQIPVSVFPATSNDELDLKTLCHGKTPKMTIRCQEGGEEYTSWQKIPERGYEWAKGEYIVLSPEELATAKEQRVKVDAIKVEKSVELRAVGRQYAFTGGYRLAPPADANDTTRASFRAISEIIEESGRAMLVRFAPGGKVRHYAIVSDEDGLLMAHEIRPKKALPYEVPQKNADPKVKAQAKMLVESMHSDDVALEPEPDPLFELVQRKLAAMGSLEGIGQTVIVPK